MNLFTILVGLFALVCLFMIIISTVKIIDQFERGVVLTLGKFTGILAPGLNFLVPFVQMVRMADIRVKVMEVKPQDVITKDNVSVKVSAVVYSKIVDPKMALLDVEDYEDAIAQLAQITLRSTIGKHSLDDRKCRGKPLA